MSDVGLFEMPPERLRALVAAERERDALRGALRHVVRLLAERGVWMPEGCPACAAARALLP